MANLKIQLIRVVLLVLFYFQLKIMVSTSSVFMTVLTLIGTLLLDVVIGLGIMGGTYVAELKADDCTPFEVVGPFLVEKYF